MTTTTRKGQTLLRGHALRWEGAAFVDRDGVAARAYGPRGFAFCECGARSDELTSTTQRRRWHVEHKERIRAYEEYRIALRPVDDSDDLDDVVVKDVSMFRAELMDAKTLWMCCYLPGLPDEHERITFYVTVVKGRLRFQVTEEPTSGDVVYEPTSEVRRG